MKAIFSPRGDMWLDRPPEYPSLIRGQPSLEMRHEYSPLPSFSDWVSNKFHFIDWWDVTGTQL